MKAEKISLGLGVLVIIMLAFVIVWKADIIGVSAANLVQDARENQNIESDWVVVQDRNDEMCAMLFFDEAKQDCTYSIYLTRDGISYGYFYELGGYDAYVAEEAKAIILEDIGIALLSLNRQGIAKIEIENNPGQQVIEVDTAKPFAFVLPIGCGEITMYDAEGNVVTLYDTYTG